MKLCWSTILAAALIVGGCNAQKQENANSSEPSGPSKSVAADTSKTTPKPSTATLPASLQTAGAKLAGFVASSATEYVVKTTQGGSTTTRRGGRSIEVKPIDDSKAIVTVTWTGDLSNLPSEAYTVTKEGIYYRSLQGKAVMPAPLFLPADPTPGKSWNSTYSFTEQSLGDMKVKSVTKIVGSQPVKVPLGEYQAVVVVDSGTLNSKMMHGTTEGKTWLTEKVGIVKAVQTMKTSGGQVAITFEAVKPQ